MHPRHHGRLIILQLRVIRQVLGINVHQAAGAIGGLMYIYSKDLPDYSQLQDYEPPVMTRVHAADGQLLAEFAKERRLYIPIQAVPKLVINAFISAEDKNFYEHAGLDFGGIARAGWLYLQNMGTSRRPQGA